MWKLVALWVATAVLAYALRPKPVHQTPKPATIDEFDVPVAEEGKEIPVLFGTREVTGPNVVWYGDLATKKIKEKTKKK